MTPNRNTNTNTNININTNTNRNRNRNRNRNSSSNTNTNINTNINSNSNTNTNINTNINTSTSPISVKPFTLLVLDDLEHPTPNLIWSQYDVRLADIGVRSILINSFATFKEKWKQISKEDSDTVLLPPTALLLLSRGDTSCIPELLEEVPTIRWIHTWYAGIDWVAESAITALSTVHSDVVVTNSRGAFGQQLAEWVMGAILHFAKDIQRIQVNKEKRSWDRFQCQRLKGLTLGLVGFGDIGHQCAKVASAFGMSIVCLRRGRDHTDLTENGVITYLTDDAENRLEVFRKADYLVVALPLTPKTKHFVSIRELSAMKPSAVFINVGRGATVDEPALCEALKSKSIHGAALDVFTTEPLPQDSELWELPNVVISPHCADWTSGYHCEAFDVFLENMGVFNTGSRTASDYVTPINITEGY